MSKPNYDILNQEFTYFGKDCRLNGIFHLTGKSFISGKVEGQLYIENDADLYIETTGTFEGMINCHNIEIYGHFHGDLNATGRITIYPSAHLKGKIRGQQITIHPGANVNIEGHTKTDLLV
ncbi:MAG: polymer-forming cytoskeletal protein [Bacteriovoracaceae bacterium]|nr:polymer-forming cytoskeletal protein [Bacteriovoracaceae bacterium]